MIPFLALAIYIVLSLTVTVWVARTLFVSGRPFLIRTFHGNETVADAVNTMLVVGFYLCNIAFVLVFVRFFAKPEMATQIIEYVCTKLGFVLLTLGCMHVGNLMLFHVVYEWQEKQLLLQAKTVGKEDQ